ncbi:hypothetical protein ACWDOP_29920 [Nocardia sp. NPDC003693]
MSDESGTAGTVSDRVGARRVWDLVAGWCLLAVAAMLAVGTGVITVFFSIADADCEFRAIECRPEFIGWAMGVSWGGAVVGVFGALVMVIAGTVRERVVWFWPVLGMVVIAAGFGLGAVLIEQVVPK